MNAVAANEHVGQQGLAILEMRLDPGVVLAQRHEPVAEPDRFGTRRLHVTDQRGVQIGTVDVVGARPVPLEHLPLERGARDDLAGIETAVDRLHGLAADLLEIRRETERRQDAREAGRDHHARADLAQHLRSLDERDPNSALQQRQRRRQAAQTGTHHQRRWARHDIQPWEWHISRGIFP